MADRRRRQDARDEAETAQASTKNTRGDDGTRCGRGRPVAISSVAVTADNATTLPTEIDAPVRITSVMPAPNRHDGNLMGNVQEIGGRGKIGQV